MNFDLVPASQNGTELTLHKFNAKALASIAQNLRKENANNSLATKI
jgi:hypothetical protein